MRDSRRTFFRIGGVLGLVLCRYQNELWHFDVVGFRPSDFLSIVKAAALLPALFGRPTTTWSILAREGLGRIFFRRIRRQRSDRQRKQHRADAQQHGKTQKSPHQSGPQFANPFHHCSTDNRSKTYGVINSDSLSTGLILPSLKASARRSRLCSTSFSLMGGGFAMRAACRRGPIKASDVWFGCTRKFADKVETLKSLSN